jgi:hypothetical protein
MVSRLAKHNDFIFASSAYHFRADTDLILKVSALEPLQKVSSAFPELYPASLDCPSAAQSDRQRIPMRYPEVRLNTSIDRNTDLSP